MTVNNMPSRAYTGKPREFREGSFGQGALLSALSFTGRHHIFVVRGRPPFGDTAPSKGTLVGG